MREWVAAGRGRDARVESQRPDLRSCVYCTCRSKAKRSEAKAATRRRRAKGLALHTHYTRGIYRLTTASAHIIVRSQPLAENNKRRDSDSINGREISIRLCILARKDRADRADQVEEKKTLVNSYTRRGGIFAFFSGHFTTGFPAPRAGSPRDAQCALCIACTHCSVIKLVFALHTFSRYWLDRVCIFALSSASTWVAKTVRHAVIDALRIRKLGDRLEK